MEPKAKWTFMVYMAGDNSLSDAGDTDLAEMRQVGSTADVNVIVQFDNAGEEGTRRFRVLNTGSDLLQSLGKTDSGSPDVLLDFIKWAAGSYSADRYALILWNHGGGWEPSEMDRLARQVGARDYSGREAAMRSGSRLRKAFFSTTLKKIFTLSSAHERAICSDDGSGHSLDTVELGTVLDQTVKALGQPLDLLGMDACLMSNLEVAYQARPYVSYIVASEESEPNEGWPYDTVLQKLVANPAVPTAELATHIVDAYIQFYVGRGISDPVTQTALDLSRLDSLMTPLDTFANALMAKLPRIKIKIVNAEEGTAFFFDYTLADIANFCEEMAKRTARTPVRKAANDVGTALQRGPGHFVLAESHRGASVARCGGVSIYLPGRIGISPYYADLAFVKDQHRWLAFLQALRGH
jgi:hypothetical protein